MPKGGEAPAGAGGGGGPRPSGGGGGAAAAATGTPPTDIESMIRQFIGDLMSGKIGMSPEAVTAMRGDAVRTARAQEAARREQLAEDLLSRGMLRAGEAPRGFSQIGRETQSAISQRFGEIAIEKSRQDIQLRVKALDSMLDWLGKKWQYEAAKEGNAIQKQIGLAQIQLGYAKIQAEKQMLEMQLASKGGGGGGPDPWQEFLARLLER